MFTSNKIRTNIKGLFPLGSYTTQQKGYQRLNLYDLPPPLSIRSIAICWLKVYNLNLLLVSSHDIGDDSTNFRFYAFISICCQKIQKIGKCLKINDTLQQGEPLISGEKTQPRLIKGKQKEKTNQQITNSNTIIIFGRYTYT